MRAVEDTSPVAPRTFDVARPALRLLPVLRPDLGLFLRATACTVAVQLTAVGAVAAGASLISRVVIDASTAPVAVLLVVLAAVVVSHGIFYWVEMWWAHVLAYRVLARIRMGIYDALERIAPGGLLRRRSGDLAGTAMADVEVLEWFYAHTAGAVLGAVLTPLLLVAVVWSLVGPLALLVALALLSVAAVPWLLAGRAAAQGNAIRADLALLKAEVLDGVQGLRELLVFGQVDRHVERIIARTRQVQRRQRSYALRVGLEGGLAEGILAITALVFLAVCAGRVSRGELSLTDLPTATVLALGAFGPVTAVFPMLQKLGEISSSAQRVHTVLDAPPNVVEAAPAAAPLVPWQGQAEDGPRPALQIRFDEVRFSYADDLTDVLEGVTFTIEAGETVALVGESGAGKSTCASLLMRFWDPRQGSIKLNGIPTTTLPQHEVRRLVGLVPQDVYLFHATLAENLLLARPNASQEQLDAAVHAALLTDVVAELSKGLETPVGERGVTLSGGQRQRVAIARALLADPAVLVMDEPVSHLDATSERLLAASMAQARSGRTTLLIAHRLSTIRGADRVVFLHAGRVIDTGSHEQLLSRCTSYRRVLSHQVPHGHEASTGQGANKLPAATTEGW